MRSLLHPFLALVLSAAALAGCSENAQPPIGRWQGVYEDAGLMVVARLEIASNGAVRVSAPNASADLSAMPQIERAELRARLLSELAQSWDKVGTLPLEFDGKDFRKPGGVAPQLEWDAKGGRMTMIYYSGTRPSVRVPLNPVNRFGGADS
jgi:hypothetical protein